MLGSVDKLFPPQPDPDPARLALARTSVQAMWPDGAYGKMMAGFMGGMFDRMMQLKKSDLAALGEKPQNCDGSAPARTFRCTSRSRPRTPISTSAWPRCAAS